MSSVVVITYGGVNITANVLFETTTFTAKVNGQVGDALVRVRDIDHTFVPVSGERLVCTIDGRIKWTGYGAQINKAYMFPAQDTTVVAEVTRIWEIVGVDDNILFDKRIIFDAEDPEGHIDWEYAAGTYDDTIVKDIFDNYLDLSSDNISREGVKRVGIAIRDIPGHIAYRGTSDTLADDESTTHTGSVAKAGYQWGQSMDLIQRGTGAMYYIDGVSHSDRRILRWVDVETLNSEYALTDTPDLSVELEEEFLPIDNPMANPSFESGLTDWETDGDVLPVDSTATSFRGFATFSGTQTYVTVKRPNVALVVGDLLLVTVMIEGPGVGDTNVVTPAAGWTLVEEFTETTDGTYFGLFQHIVDVAGTFSQNYTFNYTNTGSLTRSSNTITAAFRAARVSQVADASRLTENPQGEMTTPSLTALADGFAVAVFQAAAALNSSWVKAGGWGTGAIGTWTTTGSSVAYSVDGASAIGTGLSGTSVQASGVVPIPQPDSGDVYTPVFDDDFNRITSPGLGGNWTWEDGSTAGDTGETDGSVATVPPTDWNAWTNPDITELGHYDIRYDFWVPAAASNDAYWMYYYVELGGVYWGMSPSGQPVSTPYDLEINVGTAETVIAVDESSWYTVRVQKRAGVSQMKVWKTGTTEPDWMLTSGIIDSTALYFEMGGSDFEEGKVDNLVFEEITIEQADLWEASLDFVWPAANSATTHSVTLLFESSYGPYAEIYVAVNRGSGVMGYGWDDDDDFFENTVNPSFGGPGATGHLKLRWNRAAETMSAKYWEGAASEPAWEADLSTTGANLGGAPEILFLGRESSNPSPLPVFTFHFVNFTATTGGAFDSDGFDPDGFNATGGTTVYLDDFDRTITANTLTDIADIQTTATQQEMERSAAAVITGATIGPFTSTLTSPDVSDTIRHAWLILLDSNPTPNAGTYSGRLDGPAETSQEFAVPDGAGALSIRYRGYCESGDGLEIILENITDSTSHTILAPTCSVFTSWQTATFDLSAMEGDLVRLRLIVADGSVAFFDNITLAGSIGTPALPATTENRWNGVGGPNEPYGYSNLSIIENGTHLTNDMHVWGAALGSKLRVHSRAQDATSITLHNRQVDGLETVGLYKQVSADAVSESYIDGTPTGHRGRKDDQVTFNCQTLMPVFNVGEVVAVKNSTWDFAAALPLREMRISFFAPDLPIFDLSLGHEIDQPWAFSEYLRKLPRPFEIMRIRPPIFPPFVYLCPPPTLAGALGIGVTAMRSIFQRDFGGSSADEDDPPVVQNPPFGGAWYAGLTPADLVETLPRVMDPTDAQRQQYNIDESGFGYINGSAGTTYFLKLRTPVTGAVEYLAAYRFPYGIAAGATLSVNGSLVAERVITASTDPAFIGIKSSVSFSGTPVVLDPRLLRQPVWVRMLLIPSELGYGGLWFKIWPRDKSEPEDWSFILRDSDMPTGSVGATTYQNIGMWYSVRDTFTSGPLFPITMTITGGGAGTFGGGYEAIAIYAEHGGDAPLHGIAWNSHSGGSARAQYSPGSGPLGTWSSDFGGSYGHPGASNGFYYWGPQAGSFSQSRFTASLTGTGTIPKHTLEFSWPHFGPPWDPSLLFLSQVYQDIVSFRLGFEFANNPDGTPAGPIGVGDPPIGFVQKLPETVRVCGEVWLASDTGGRLYGGANLPFPVLLSFNWYGFGDGNPFWTTPYEALPVARHYVNYNPAAGGGELTGEGRFWKYFEFDIPIAGGAYEAGDYIQWGVTFVGDMQEQFRAGLPNSQPPGGFFTNQDSVSIRFRNLQYKSTYLTDEVGTYFCVERDPLHLVGGAIGIPAYDTGDNLTYRVGSAYIGGSTSVWVNGMVQRYGATEDYTENPAEGLIVFNTPLDPDDEVIVDFEGTGPALP